VSTKIEVLRTWPGGPLREFAVIRPKPGWGIPYDGPRPYANCYVCERCRKSCFGVYFLELESNYAQIALGKSASVDSPRCHEQLWVCGSCKLVLIAKQERLKVVKRTPTWSRA
jgi:hypothetical protein